MTSAPFSFFVTCTVQNKKQTTTNILIESKTSYSFIVSKFTNISTFFSVTAGKIQEKCQTGKKPRFDSLIPIKMFC